MRSLPLLLAALLLAIPPAAAAEGGACTGATLTGDAIGREFDKPMTYVSGRAGGRSVLQATGEIRRGESARLADALQRAGRVEEVWFHSPGGAADEGIKMGRVLRRAGVMTRLRTGRACISACSTAFLGGTLRVVEPRSYFGIHMMTATRNTDLMVEMADDMAKLARLRKAALRQHLDADEVNRLISDAAGRTIRLLEQVAARHAAEQARYLVEMSVSLEFMTEEFTQSADGVCYLGEAGLRKFNVANTGEATVSAPPEPPAPPPVPAVTASAPTPPPAARP